MTKKYNVIPIEDYYVIVDKKFENGDTVYYRHPAHENGMITTVINKSYSDYAPYAVHHTEGYGVKEGYNKVIATIGERVGDLPLIEIPSEIENIVEDMIEEDLLELKNWTPYHKESYRKGVVRGYKAATKLYSEDDMKGIFYVGVQLGINQSLALEGNGNIKLQNEEEVATKFLKSLDKPITSVELEVESYNPLEEGTSSVRRHIRLVTSENNTITPINIFYE